MGRLTTDYKIIVRLWEKWQLSVHLVQLSHSLTTTCTMCVQDTKTFPNVMLVGMASEISKDKTLMALTYHRARSEEVRQGQRDH